MEDSDKIFSAFIEHCVDIRAKHFEKSILGVRRYIRRMAGNKEEFTSLLKDDISFQKEIEKELKSHLVNKSQGYVSEFKENLERMTSHCKRLHFRVGFPVFYLSFITGLFAILDYMVKDPLVAFTVIAAIITIPVMIERQKLLEYASLYEELSEQLRQNIKKS